MSTLTTILGTQTFKPGYHFTDENPILETAARIYDLGCDVIKFEATDDTIADQILSRYPFKHVVMWYGHGPVFKESERNAEYRAIYNYTKHLLTTYNNSGISFYLGHWEGDWYYLGGYNTEKTQVPQGVTEGMIAWLNNRQKAVEDACRDTPHENVYIWNYSEINRPVDAIEHGYDRMLNRVIPHLNVDYISYSAYDCMELPAEEVAHVIDEIYKALPPKEGIDGPRVWIGEVCMPQHMCHADPEEHAKINLSFLAKYLACPVKFILYWEIYCNEQQEDGSPRGFWLIDDQNRETPLFKALQDAIAKEKKFADEYLQTNGKEPSNEEVRKFLLSLPCFQL